MSTTNPVWYQKRELHQLVRMFNNSVNAGDELGAASIYGCLFDLLCTAQKRAEDKRHGYRWKRMVNYLETELTNINEQAQDYPTTIQQALVSKIILHRNMKKAG